MRGRYSWLTIVTQQDVMDKIEAFVNHRSHTVKLAVLAEFNYQFGFGRPNFLSFTTCHSGKLPKVSSGSLK